MGTYSINIYRSYQRITALDDFEEAVHHRALTYTTKHLLLTGAISKSDLEAGLQLALPKAMKVLLMAGINSNEHFKQVYVCDLNTGEVYKDLLMSKKGFSLIMMHLPLNNQSAHWIWQFADI